MLTVDVQSAPPAVMLFCSGRIVLGAEAETLRCMVKSRPEQHLLLDLHEVQSLDAAGLGLLVELHCWAQERDSRLILMNPARWIRKLIAMTNLGLVLQTASPHARQSAWHGHDDEGDRQAMTA
jgi:anti-anti-sigma factor